MKPLLLLSFQYHQTFLFIFAKSAEYIQKVGSLYNCLKGGGSEVGLGLFCQSQAKGSAFLLKRPYFAPGKHQIRY